MNGIVDHDERARQDELSAVRRQLGERPAFDDLIARWHAPFWHYYPARVRR